MALAEEDLGSTGYSHSSGEATLVSLTKMSKCITRLAHIFHIRQKPVRAEREKNIHLVKDENYLTVQANLGNTRVYLRKTEVTFSALND